MSAKVFCGIDPGLTGAVAFLREGGEILDVVDMPVQTTSTGRKQIDGAELAAILVRYLPSFVLLERVGARPGEGAVGAFAFGHGLGVIQGALAALAIPHQLVQPAVWKRAAGIPAGAPKAASITTCSQLIPSSSAHLRLVKHHGRAEALLLARHALSHHHTTRTPK